MAAFRIAQTVDLNNAHAQPAAQLNGHVGDALAHVWAVTLVRNGAAEDLTGHSALAIHNRADGATLEIIASISGNIVTVTFPQASYVYEGQGQAVLLRLTKAATGAETTVAGAQLNVAEGETGTPTDPSTTIPTLSELLAQIDAANAAATAANEAATYANGVGAGLNARTGALETAVAGHATRLSTAETTVAGHTLKLAEIGTLPAANLVTNGNFANGTTGWSGIDSIVSGVAKKTATAQYAAMVQAIPNYANYKGHKLYVRALVTSTSNGVILDAIDGVLDNTKAHSGSGAAESLSVVMTVSASATLLYIKIQDNRASGWTEFSADNVLAIDLTATFGAGKEPSKAVMDAYLAYFPNSWFDSTANLAAAQQVLPALIEARKLLVDPEWIYPTLINSWLSVTDGSFYAASYRKDNFGKVELRGRVTAGTGNGIFILPVGYRPAKCKYFRVSATTGNGATIIIDNGEQVGVNGQVTLQGGIVTPINLDGISFYI